MAIPIDDDAVEKLIGLASHSSDLDAYLDAVKAEESGEEPVNEVLTEIAAEVEILDIHPGIIPQGPADKVTVLELKNHPIVGTYVTETVTDEKRGDRWNEIFIGSHKVAVTELTPEQVIDRIHSLQDEIVDRKAQMQGLRTGLETLLKGVDSNRRADLLARDKRHRVKKVETAASTKGPGTGSSKGKTKGMKTADTLLGLGMTKDAVVAKLRDLKLYGELEQSYMEKKG